MLFFTSLNLIGFLHKKYFLCGAFIIKNQVCLTYWIFNQLLTCAPCKDAPLTHGHVITIVAKTLNVDLAAYTRKVECSYFTNHALVRGEVCDAGFRFIPAHSCSCWRGIARASRVDEPPTTSEYQTESDPEEELPQYQPFGEVLC